VIDRAIQAFGAAGLSDDFGLAAAFVGARSLRIADGPDEVHMMTIARLELQQMKASKALERGNGTSAIPSCALGVLRAVMVPQLICSLRNNRGRRV
jgi:hypothetical protein